MLEHERFQLHPKTTKELALDTARYTLRSETCRYLFLLGGIKTMRSLDPRTKGKIESLIAEMGTRVEAIAEEMG